MNRYTLAGIAAVTLVAGAALAQTPPASPQPPAPPTAESPPPPPHPGMGMGMGMGGEGPGRGRWRMEGEMRRMHGMMPPPPPRGAFFHFQHADSEVTIRCAANEPMRACVDAATAMLDKLQAAQPKP